MKLLTKPILQFKISLIDSKPLIWRRIQIVESSSFYDLHVAIQDAMGWEDYHMHQFIIYTGSTKKTTQRTCIGIPDDDMGDDSNLAGWETKIVDYLGGNEKRKIIYEYDFGDSWEHLIEFEGYFDKDHSVKKYPICCDGEMACPPEDSGGTWGYYDMLDAVNDKNHPNHAETLEWLGDKFNPEVFDKTTVKFHNPKTRLKEFLKHSDWV